MPLYINAVKISELSPQLEKLGENSRRLRGRVFIFWYLPHRLTTPHVPGIMILFIIIPSILTAPQKRKYFYHFTDAENETQGQSQIGPCHECLLLTSTRIKSCAAAAADLQKPWRNSGWRVGMRHSMLQETGSTGVQIVRYSQELILWAQFLYLLISRKALKSFMVTIVTRD